MGRFYNCVAKDTGKFMDILLILTQSANITGDTMNTEAEEICGKRAGDEMTREM